MPTDRARFATADGARISYTVEGSGRPVVLLHAIGLDRTIWSDYAPQLFADRTVIALDLPGHGVSDPPEKHPTLSSMADAVLAVLHAESLERVDVLGISMGGMVAQTLAIQHRASVASLILCSTAATFPTPVRAAIRARGDAAAADGMAAVTPGTIERWFSPDGRSGHAARHCADLLLNDDPGTFASCWYAIADLDTAQYLTEVRVPTLVITGDADISLPADASAVLASSIPDCRTVVVPGGWHLGALETPEPYRTPILDFLRTSSSGHTRRPLES